MYGTFGSRDTTGPRYAKMRGSRVRNISAPPRVANTLSSTNTRLSFLNVKAQLYTRKLDDFGTPKRYIRVRACSLKMKMLENIHVNISTTNIFSLNNTSNIINI